MRAAALALDAPTTDSTPIARFLTTAQVCAMTGYHRTTIQRAVDGGALTRYGLPRAPRYLEHEVIEWMRSPASTPAPRATYRERAGLPGSSLRW